jgi:hypothetical protein
MPDLKISPELALLIKAALEGKGNQPVSLSGSNINWDKLVRQAKWHQIQPLLLDHLQTQQDQLEIPKKYLETLTAFAVGQAVTNMAFLGISVNLYQQLIAADVKAFLMKGALWAWLLYEKPAQREFGDIDFFIEKNDLNKSLAVLRTNGFAPDAYRQHLFGQDALQAAYLATDYQLPLQPVNEHTLQSLEVQWRPSYPRYCYDLSWEELTSEMIQVNLNTSTIQIPRLENQLLMMVIHHCGVEQWDKLKYMADFVRLLRKNAGSMDWGYIQKISRQNGFENLLKNSVGLAQLLTGETFVKSESFDTSRFKVSSRFCQEILAHWENERPVLKSKSWQIFLYNMRYRDNLKIKLAILWAHAKYLSNWKLLLSKAHWYRRNRL